MRYFGIIHESTYQPYSKLISCLLLQMNPSEPTNCLNNVASTDLSVSLVQFQISFKLVLLFHYNIPCEISLAHLTYTSSDARISFFLYQQIPAQRNNQELLNQSSQNLISFPFKFLNSLLTTICPQ